MQVPLVLLLLTVLAIGAVILVGFVVAGMIAASVKRRWSERAARRGTGRGEPPHA